MSEIVAQCLSRGKTAVAKSAEFWYTCGAMIKEIDVAGIPLDNYSVRELSMILERELSKPGFHTIEEVNTDTLMLTASDDLVRKALLAMEHTVISEAAILEAVNAGTYQRRREVEHHDFFYEIMRLFERNHKKICLLGVEESRTLAMEEKLCGLFPRCTMVSFALELYEGAADALVNEINAATADVILSILPSPLQEHFFMENRDKLSANLWYGIGLMNPETVRKGFLGWIDHHIRTYRLGRYINSSKQESVKNGSGKKE